MKKTYTVNTNATDQTEPFPLKPRSQLTIHHSAAGSSPSGTWTLEAYNFASDAWETVTDASAEFTNPSGSDASGIANYTNPHQGIGRVVYTTSSGGAASGGTVIVYQDFGR